MSEWQPIETAPKDVNLLLSDGKRVSYGGWITDVDHGAEWEGQLGMAGWWSVDLDMEPAYWMFPPAPPSAV